MSLKRLEVIEAARECVGTPFIHQGRILGKGLDCVGLVRYPLVKLLGTKEDYRGYTMFPSEHQVATTFGRWFERKFREPVPGDILLIAIEGNGQHFAILTDDRTIIHALNAGPLKVVEHGYRPPWPSRCVAVYEYPGVEEWQP